MIEIKKIKFYKKSEIKKPIKRTFSEASEREQNTLLNNLKLIPTKEQPVALSVFYKYSESFHHKEEWRNKLDKNYVVGTVLSVCEGYYKTKWLPT